MVSKMIFNRRLNKTLLFLFLLSVIFCACDKKSIKKDELNKDSTAIEQQKESKVDFDLTKMSSKMVYAQVFNMLVSPETYENKTIRMKGNFEIYEASEIMPQTYAVIIYDALACCQQGIEFRYDFKGNVPQKTSEIIVTGKFLVTEIEPGISYNYVQAESVEF